MLELLLINSVIWLVAKSLEWEMVTFATSLKAYSTVALLLQKQYSLHRIPRSRVQLGTMLWWTRSRTRMSSSSLLVKTESRAVANSIGSRLYPAWFPAFGAIHLQLHDTATLVFASSPPLIFTHTWVLVRNSKSFLPLKRHSSLSRLRRPPPEPYRHRKYCCFKKQESGHHPVNFISVTATSSQTATTFLFLVQRQHTTLFLSRTNFYNQLHVLRNLFSSSPSIRIIIVTRSSNYRVDWLLGKRASSSQE